MEEEILEKLKNGRAVVLDKKHIQWGVIITIIIFLMTQVFVFATWKATTDSKFESVDAKIQVVNVKVDNLKETGTRVALESQTMLLDVIHNQKRMMEKLNLKWESLNIK